MDFSKRQADPRKHLAGITFVILFHALIVYALVTGLAKKVVEVVIAPIETKVLEEVRKPPPPPEIIVPPPPKLEAPPPPFIPPPEVQITAPPPPAPTITAVTPTPPPAPVVIAPAPPPPAPAPPAPPAPPPPAPPKPAGPVQAGIACSKTPQPEVAISEPVEGSIFVKATVKAGRITDIVFERDTLRGANTRTKRALRDSIETAMQAYVCAGDGVQVVQEFYFKIN